jgi:hypothetical protein
MIATPFEELTNRDRAIPHAVGSGTAELICSAQPDLFVDGRFCCDQRAVRCLARAGLIGPAVFGAIGQRVPAVLTAAGRALLAA